MSSPSPRCVAEEQVLLLPYHRGAYGRDALYWLWKLAEADGATGRIFYAQACPDESWRGDLVEWMAYFSQTTPRRDVVMILRKADQVPLGLVWVDEVPGQPYGLLGLWYTRKTLRLAREGTALACRYMREGLGYPRLRGFTPWREAVQHVLPLGWRKIATLPAFLMIEGRPRDLYVLEDGEKMHGHISGSPGAGMERSGSRQDTHGGRGRDGLATDA